MGAIRTFFHRYPQWHEKIVFVLVVVPSRERVERYAALKREIDELVGHINSEFGTLDWTPIRYIYRSLAFGELIGLYHCADIALVTPLRDGMNLIAKEYLAVKEDNTGVLILSEMAGAAKELVEALELQNLLLCGEMLGKAALMRSESRGSHYREDHPQRDDANWLKSIAVKNVDGRMVLDTIALHADWRSRPGDMGSKRWAGS